MTKRNHGLPRPPLVNAITNAKFELSLAAWSKGIGLPDFETIADCDERQKAMLQRLGRATAPTTSGTPLAHCTAHHCAATVCVEACHFGTLHRRVAALTTGLPILAAHQGPQWAVTIVHPLWEAPIGELATISVKAAAEWNYRRLCSLGIAGLVATGSFEVSLNRELDGALHWAGEIQQIVTGATDRELKRAFQIEDQYRDARPGQRMVDVRTFKYLTRKFAYGQKRFVEERRAYISDVNGRQARRHLPPPDQQWAEFDAWLLGIPLGGRIVAYGCGRRGTTFFARK